MLRINIRCGQTPTRDWVNFDNSFSLRLSKLPLLPDILHKLRFLDDAQYQFIKFARKNYINGNISLSALCIFILNSYSYL